MPNDTLKFFNNSLELKQWRAKQSMPLAFVPTMGNLHLGHLSLIEQAFSKTDDVVVSIFINPKQFGNVSDFNSYPRTLEQDISQLKNLLLRFPNKRLVLFSPANANDIYTNNFATSISLAPWNQILEGKMRPGHFDGVCVVVTILLNLIQPKFLLLGKKDYQQLAVLKKLIADLQFNLDVVPGATIRDFDGLALSSRNVFLKPSERKMAPTFYSTLKVTADNLKNAWKENKSWPQNLSEIINRSKNTDLTWDYLELRQQSFEELTPTSTQLVLLGVIRFDQLRLLDNFEFAVGEN